MTDHAAKGDQRFPRARRLTEASQYQRVFAGATKAGGPYFTVLGQSNGSEQPRLGMAVSRRSAPRAVDRNRIKRLIRESFRHEHDRIGGLDLVVLAKPAAREADNAALVASLKQQWQRLSKRCARS